MTDQKLQVIPLGGLGEFGMNMTAIRYADDIIVVDSGMMFPDAELLGVDLVINAFVLIGILLAFAVASGFALGGVRALMRRSRHGEEPDAMITLHLERP